jgi:two-component system, cell cycle response regulator
MSRDKGPTTGPGSGVPRPDRATLRSPVSKREPEGPPTGRLPRLDTLGDTESDDFRTRTSQTAIKISPAGAPRNPILTVLTGLSAGQIFALNRDELIVGRGHDRDIRLDDPGISRGHCRFQKTTAGMYIVEDLDSTNGTYLNGKVIKAARVNVGDRIQVGADVVLRFSLTDDTEETLAKRLYESSTRDPLTGAFTRKYFDERLKAEIAYATRHNSPLGVLLFDLDRFKSINDQFGHAAGDAVLVGVATRVSTLIRTEDIFARYGGEEFVVLARGIKRKNTIMFAERIRKSVGKLRVDFKRRSIGVTLSIGVSMLEEVEAKTGEALVGLADARLYRAKDAGRDRTIGE